MEKDYRLIMAVLGVCGSGYLIVKSYRERKVFKQIPKEIRNSAMYINEIEAAVNCSLQAGYNIMQALKTAKNISSKSAIDFVTDTDKNNEILIFNLLRQQFPNYKFIGEEASAEIGSIATLSNDPTWIVDPVDGTTNFVHCNPNTCVSIGLAVHNQPVVGVVFAPAMDELYIAVRGVGAFLNGERIRVSDVNCIKDAMICTEFGYDRTKSGVHRMCTCLEQIMHKAPHAIRQLGSGVLNLCYVACGRQDAVYAGVAGEKWFPWDYCAGSLMVTEAGGHMCTVSGEAFDLYGSVLAASSKALADEMVDTLKPVLHT